VSSCTSGEGGEGSPAECVATTAAAATAAALTPTAAASARFTTAAAAASTPGVVRLHKAHHSRQEFSFAAYMLQGLELSVSAKTILEAVREGHRRGGVDVAIVLPDGPVVLAEWDGGYWHGDARLQEDVRKTQRMLEVPNAVAVRVRCVKAAAFPDIKGAVVVREARNPAKAVQSLAGLLAAHVPAAAAAAARLKQHATGMTVPLVEDAVNSAWGSIDPEYNKLREDLQTFAGSKDLAERLLSHGAVRTRPDAVLDVGVRLCGEEANMRMVDVVRMRPGFWALCDRPDVAMGFVADLLAMGISAHRLATFGDCFWSAADHRPAELAAAVAELQRKGIEAHRLATFGDGFWFAATKHPAKLAAAVVELQGKGLDAHRLATFGGCFWSAAAQRPAELAAAVAELQRKAIEAHRLATFGDGFWSAATKHPAKLAAAVADLLAMGISAHRLATFGGSFWSAAAQRPAELAAAVAELQRKGIKAHRLATFGDGFWSAATKHPAKLAAAVADLLAMGISAHRLAAFGDGFWSAATKHPAELAAAVAELQRKGIEAHRLAAFGDGFWSAVAKHPAELAATIALLAKLGVADDALPKFADEFWARWWCHKEVLVLLTNDVGLGAPDVHKLRAFWASLKSDADVVALRAELAALRTSTDVTRCLVCKNKARAIGFGARRVPSSSQQRQQQQPQQQPSEERQQPDGQSRAQPQQAASAQQEAAGGAARVLLAADSRRCAFAADATGAVAAGAPGPSWAPRPSGPMSGGASARAGPGPALTSAPILTSVDLVDLTRDSDDSDEEQPLARRPAAVAKLGETEPPTAGAGPRIAAGGGGDGPPSKVARVAGAAGGGGGEPRVLGKQSCTLWRALCWIAWALGVPAHDEVRRP